METPIEVIQKVLGYRIKDEELFYTALTHRSAEKNNNERLEFLGDSVLGLLITVALYDRFPNSDEGTLTRCRARLVRQETLADIARNNQLGQLIIMGEGAARSGASDRSSVLADVLESVIGAVYLEAGLEVVRSVVDRLFFSYWESLDPETLNKDPKTELQERLQKLGRCLPRYSVTKSIGEPHDRQFVVECVLDKTGASFQGQGKSRQKAEQKAADLALKYLEL